MLKFRTIAMNNEWIPSGPEGSSGKFWYSCADRFPEWSWL